MKNSSSVNYDSSDLKKPIFCKKSRKIRIILEETHNPRKIAFYVEKIGDKDFTAEMCSPK